MKSDFVEISNNGRPSSSVPSEHESVQELVSREPDWLVKWGNIFFVVLFLLVVLTSWIFPYPTVVKSPAKLSLINSPKSISSKIDGELIQLSCVEGEVVKKGQIIGSIESIGDPKTILLLDRQVSSLLDFLKEGNISDSSISTLNINPSNLGELQNSYQSFSQSLLKFKDYLPSGYYMERKKFILENIVKLNEINKNLLEEQKLKKQDLTLANESFSVSASLFDSQVISAEDYRVEKSKLINKNLLIHQTNTNLLNNSKLQIEQREELVQLENDIFKQSEIFRQEIHTFLAHIEEWKEKYLLKAPISGKIVFSSIIEQNQELSVGEVICWVIPDDTEYFVELYIPQSNLGKVKRGQKVRLKFPSYPYQEYGSLIGEIDYISEIPTEEGFLAKASLPKGLTTNYNKSIYYRDGLVAEAEIYLEDKKLITKLFENVTGLLE